MSGGGTERWSPWVRSAGSAAASGGCAGRTEGADDGGGDGDDESHESSLGSEDEDRVQGLDPDEGGAGRLGVPRGPP